MPRLTASKQHKRNEMIENIYIALAKKEAEYNHKMANHYKILKQPILGRET